MPGKKRLKSYSVFVAAPSGHMTGLSAYSGKDGDWDPAILGICPLIYLPVSMCRLMLGLARLSNWLRLLVPLFFPSF